jgi:hypothetical protein
MNGLRDIGREYTGKHRRDSGPGVLPPAWGSRAEPPGGPAVDGWPGPAAGPMRGIVSIPGALPMPWFRSEPGQWADAG